MSVLAEVVRFLMLDLSFLDPRSLRSEQRQQSLLSARGIHQKIYNWILQAKKQ